MASADRYGCGSGIGSNCTSAAAWAAGTIAAAFSDHLRASFSSGPAHPVEIAPHLGCQLIRGGRRNACYLSAADSDEIHPINWARSAADSRASMGRGIVDWLGQFKALKRDGYRNAVSLETHWRGAGTPEESTRQSWAGMKHILEKAGAL